MFDRELVAYDINLRNSKMPEYASVGHGKVT